MVVHIERSKCDLFVEWVKLVVEATDSDLCAVALMLGYLVQRGSSQGPLFLFKDGHLQTHDCLVLALRSALVESGITPSLYTDHSFYLGAATTAVLQGLQDSLINTKGGGLASSAYMVYIRTLQSTLVSVAGV